MPPEIDFISSLDNFFILLNFNFGYSGYLLCYGLLIFAGNPFKHCALLKSTKYFEGKKNYFNNGIQKESPVYFRYVNENDAANMMRIVHSANFYRL